MTNHEPTTGSTVTRLPDSLTLMRLYAAGKTHAEIAAEYDVRPQAVGKALRLLGVSAKGSDAPVTSLIPFDLGSRPDKPRLINHVGFKGLRAFLRRKKGEALSARSQVNYSAFLGHVAANEVLALLESGFAWVPREAQDGKLVIRWPEGAPAPSKQQQIAFERPA